MNIGLSFRDQTAILAGKLTSLATRWIYNGGGTAAPGLIALKIQPNLLSKLLSSANITTIVVTGTNGKTTTSRVISHCLKQLNERYIHNRAGSNLERGLVSELLRHTSIKGISTQIKTALWELDEAEFSRSIHKLNPTVVVLLNLFRDQLDRYGEVESTRKKWEASLKKVNGLKTIIYNNDDPQIVTLIRNIRQELTDVEYAPYGVYGENSTSQNSLLEPLSLVLCPNCNTKLDFSYLTTTGSGGFKCSNCAIENDKYILRLKPGELSIKGSNGVIEYQGSWNFHTNLCGLFNLYNYAAALLTLSKVGYKLDDVIANIGDMKEAFGRMEQVTVGNTKLLLCLIKNPTGANEMLRTVFHNNFHAEGAGFILNDNFADGKDVSWIWDVAFEKYATKSITQAFVAGKRAYDMALRLEHAGLGTQYIKVESAFSDLIDALQNMNLKTRIPLFVTYTAMLELQKILEKKGVKRKFLEE